MAIQTKVYEASPGETESLSSVTDWVPSIPVDGSSIAGSRRVKLSSARSRSSLLETLVSWAFYAFMFSLPFEAVDLGVPLEVTTIFGGLLLLAALFQPRHCFRSPPGAFWCYAVFLYLFTVVGFFQGGEYLGEVLQDVVKFTQLMVLFWIAYSLMHSERIATTALLMLAASCTLLAFLLLTGIAGGGHTRLTAFGLHPNDVARILSLGLLSLIGLSYGLNKGLLSHRVLVWPAFALLGIAVVLTGSRGGLLALGAGLLTFVLTGGTTWTKIRNGFVVFLGIGFFVWVSTQSELTRDRFDRALETGEVARREQIYPMAWQMFKEKPLLGWGTVTSSYELGSRLAHREEFSKNPHNLILAILTNTGLLGAIPMFAGIWLTVRAAWKARRGTQGILPLAMLVAVLVANMSGVWLFNKLHWLVVAYALASGGCMVAKRSRRAITRSPLPTYDNRAGQIIPVPNWR
jgi:O-antigen ligase